MSDSERQTLKTIRWWSREALHITNAILRPGALPNIVEHALHADSEPVFIRD